MSPASVVWLLAALFLVLGTGLCGLARRRLRRVRALLRTGARAEGTVIRLEVEELRGPSGGNARIPAYRPVIGWTAADGRPRETTFRFARPRERTLPLHSRVAVFHDPADPARWTVESDGSGVYGFLLALGAFFALVGLVLLGTALAGWVR